MNFLDRIFVEPIEQFCEKIIRFMPNMLTSVAMLLIGVVAGSVLRWLFLRVFSAVNIDKYCERFGMMEILRKGGVQEPVSVILSRIIKWITIFIFIVIALQSLNFPSVIMLMDRFFLYLPNVFISALLLFAGYILANFGGRAVLIAAVNSGIRSAGLMSRLVRIFILLLSLSMALEQLDIGKGTIVFAFSILLGGAVLALAIAFGLGGRDIARKYLEKKILKNDEKDDIEHL
ncbi:MAG TPA: hypothetical protein VK448_12230 [Dissulfurispiraceae bacterium]|nr:hypothetical protein [Dissulfurispiraceae bacterium]